MGASTGNMLVNRQEALEKTFHNAAELGLPVVTHCENSDIIKANWKRQRSSMEMILTSYITTKYAVKKPVGFLLY